MTRFKNGTIGSTIDFQDWAVWMIGIQVSNIICLEGVFTATKSRFSRLPSQMFPSRAKQLDGSGVTELKFQEWMAPWAFPFEPVESTKTPAVLAGVTKLYPNNWMELELVNQLQ